MTDSYLRGATVAVLLALAIFDVKSCRPVTTVKA